MAAKSKAPAKSKDPTFLDLARAVSVVSSGAAPSAEDQKALERIRTLVRKADAGKGETSDE